MITRIKRTFFRLLPVTALLMLTGCDGDCGGCGPEVAVVIDAPAPVVVYPYGLAVVVSDRAGFTLGGASVDLVVAMVPEKRFSAVTGRDGVAWFYFDAPPDVVAIAYACAPGYACNASDVGTRPDRYDLRIQVVLR
ncbi:MAG TPA: hypothetical protein PKE26_03120 [Kiritimatiellia bacterium]|nr:hypothetical protein [Kiritimatiellia bacterium]HMO98081.1 hypothetical protein [Kiritimatiellia bacterium]HMP97356.1 hypothetical protein [Kiritimatiellia bacterium]